MTALGGHINHIYEDFDLRFRDLKTIIKGLGFCDFDVYEKIDGQNLFIAWDFDNDKLKVARNKQNIKDGGLDRYGLSLKFGDRPKIESLFIGAYDVLSKVISRLEHNVKTQIFGSMGTIWFPIEIINPELPNTINYDEKSIVFHEYYPVLFGFDGEPITRALPRNIEMLKQAVPIMNDGLFDWEIREPRCFQSMPADQSIVDRACQTLDDYRRRSGVQEATTIRNFLAERLKEDMQRFPLVPESIRSGLSRSLVKITGATPTSVLLATLDTQTRKHTQDMLKEEKSIILPKLLKPIENIVHQFSSALLSHMSSEYIEDHMAEAHRIRKEYDRCCEIIRNGKNPKHQNLLAKMHPKIGAGLVTMEGLVFEYADKLFKITGAFAPMNRVIATVKYANVKKVQNLHDVPLSMFIQSS